MSSLHTSMREPQRRGVDWEALRGVIFWALVADREGNDALLGRDSQFHIHAAAPGPSFRKVAL